MDSSLERVEDLLVKRSLEGLEDTEAAELHELLESHPQVDVAAFERAVAAIDVSCVSIAQPMPAGLYEEIETTGRRMVADRAAPETQSAAVASVDFARQRRAAAPAASPRRRRTSSVTPWFVAAASVVFAIISWWGPGPTTPGIDVAESREMLIASGAQVQSWTATDDPTATAAAGDIVWDEATQQGYMRFTALSVNDPDEFQYQLWIFDAERDERYPIDGGVFDVPAGGGEIIVPISAKLPVSQAVLFAVTVEAPGGVVVSSRERIALLAEFG